MYIDSKLIDIIKNMYDKAISPLLRKGEICECFPTKTSLRQGAYSRLLFLIFSSNK